MWLVHLACMFMHLHVENRGQLQVVYHPPFLGSGVGPLVGLGCPKYVRLRSELQESPCLCPPGAAQAYRYTLPYLTFLILVLGLELRSSCLRDKLLTDQTISLGLLSFFWDSPALYSALPWTCGPLLFCINRCCSYRHELPCLSRISFGVSLINFSYFWFES